ncbi:MAG: hypothetical protein LBT56_02540 [Prevotellaceae bacterium]|jgi:hypothetical protein|nr:hypothetical protein [Prevotellaceae bacterium]
MKNFAIIALMFFAANIFGQETNSKNGYKNNSIKVVYEYKRKQINEPVYFVNNKLFLKSMSVLKQEQIESINVGKRDTIIDGMNYYGQIYITTKQEFTPTTNSISLRDLKAKYTNLGDDKPAIFMIDDKIIKHNSDEYNVDEDYVFRIIVDKLENKNDNVDLWIIKILTKSEKNIKDSKQIILRGL